jgi:hypothetical protein
MAAGSIGLISSQALSASPRAQKRLDLQATLQGLPKADVLQTVWISNYFFDALLNIDIARMFFEIIHQFFNQCCPCRVSPVSDLAINMSSQAATGPQPWKFH